MEAQSAKLIKCGSCQNEISMTAKTCPKCGGENNWQHPEVKRFLEFKDKIKTGCQFELFNTRIEFYARKAPLWKVQWHIGKLVALWFIAIVADHINWAPLLGIGTVVLAFLIAVAEYTLPVVAFVGLLVRIAGARRPPGPKYTIEFTQEPPLVSTNDAAFWKEIDSFFNPIKNKNAA